jgi:hypothetical protein
MKIYYAHMINTYGTPQESRDIKMLEAMGLTVINPNAPEHSKGYAEGGMPYFIDVISSCDGLAFRGMPDGSIPAGIATEIKYNHDLNEHPEILIELPCAFHRRTLNVVQTREFLNQVGYR